MLRLIKNGAPAENAAADALRRMIIKAWPDVESDPHTDIRLMTGVYLSGQKVDDLDLVLLAAFENPREVSLYDNRGTVVGSYLLGSLCTVIEVKGHRYESVEMRAGALWVDYDGEQKNATKQNLDQMHSLARFLAMAGAGRPHITRFIWLDQVTNSELRSASTKADVPHEIILRDSTWEDVLFSIWRGWRGRHPDTRGFAPNRYFISADIDRHTPADFNLISKALTNEEMLLRPFSYVDLPQQQLLPQPVLHLDRSISIRKSPSSPFAIRNFLLAFTLMIGVGLAAAFFTPRVLLWGQQQEASPRAGNNLASYGGRYRCQSNSETSVITISDEGKRLRMSSTSGDVDLLSTALDEFKTTDASVAFKGRVRFTRTRAGTITSLSLLSAERKSITCPRIP